VVDTGLHVHVAPAGLHRRQDGVRDGLARRHVGQAAGHAVAAGRSHEDAAVDVAVDAVAVVVLIVAVGHIGLRRRLAGAPAGGAVAGAGAHAGIERRLDGAGLRGAHVGGIAVAEAAQRGALVERAGAHDQGLAAVAARARDGRAVARAELATERVGQAQIARGRRALAVALAGCAEAGRVGHAHVADHARIDGAGDTEAAPAHRAASGRADPRAHAARAGEDADVGCAVRLVV